MRNKNHFFFFYFSSCIKCVIFGACGRWFPLVARCWYALKIKINCFCFNGGKINRESGIYPMPGLAIIILWSLRSIGASEA